MGYRGWGPPRGGTPLAGGPPLGGVPPLWGGPPHRILARPPRPHRILNNAVANKPRGQFKNTTHYIVLYTNHPGFAFIKFANPPRRGPAPRGIFFLGPPRIAASIGAGISGSGLFQEKLGYPGWGPPRGGDPPGGGGSPPRGGSPLIWGGSPPHRILAPPSPP